MRLKSYLEDVESRSLIDYDGHGHPVVDGRVIEDVLIKPSDGTKFIPEGTTHVVWYNR